MILNKFVLDRQWSNDKDIDSYIINTFNLFLNTKTKIQINIHQIAATYKQISHLLFDDVGRTNKFEWEEKEEIIPCSGSLLNVFHNKTVSIFPNLNEVVINTTGSTGSSVYRFNLLSFLESIKSSKSSIKYTIKSQRERYYDWNDNKSKYEESWCYNIYDESIEKSYREKGWNIKYEKRMEYETIPIDCLIISAE